MIAKPVEMTEQQASDFLRVSRPFLVDLLETGAIPFKRVGADRCVSFDDLQHYKETIDAKRLEVLEELAAQAQKLNTGY